MSLKSGIILSMDDIAPDMPRMGRDWFAVSSEAVVLAAGIPRFRYLRPQKREKPARPPLRADRFHEPMRQSSHNGFIVHPKKAFVAGWPKENGDWPA
jgi:hypothetical protein